MLPKIYRSDPDIRKHQINTLKIFNDNVVEICEGHEYQISFKSDRHELCLHISLSNEFPNEKPLLTISPPIVHPWVNADSEVTSAPGLLNFSIHSDLGRVVQAIIREFERNPPPLKNDSNNITPGPGSTITSPTVPIRECERSSPSYCAVNNFSSPTHQKRLVFPELKKLSMDELEFLNNNSDRQLEFLNDLPPIKEQNKLLDDLIVQVEELAESNLSKQEQLSELRSEIEQKIGEVTKLAFENERLHMKYQDMSDKYSPFNIKEQLRLAAEKAESECESIADGFLKGEVDVDKFVNLYTKARSLCQARKTKEEKLSHQLESLSKAGF
ncbi:vacuolar protein sorting-associated protein 37A [Tribolium castaneum]|uniref:Vacuolar protein sorting-associated protein 37A-like Protein n=1 Tax=Tribolium castaneum TaxID=7070 RepID=D6WNM6_TRICA|nr:PREDICTED: vacuolar protein sorting-associated protein 37A [Tribolium castaneum]EFA03761.1 Vacuolar protein sorting-associated protein 37A-like Protein [Tribolium castaneum]|eukprot:XP_969328.1 PREDICTED: vacuolar protein sorting-associated protein 37A [Tribolium castaneum]